MYYQSEKVIKMAHTNKSDYKLYLFKNVMESAHCGNKTTMASKFRSTRSVLLHSKTLKPTLCAKGQQMKQLHVKRLVTDWVPLCLNFKAFLQSIYPNIWTL